MASWTLEYGGLEKSFADWGISLKGAQRRRQSQARDTLTFVVPGLMDAAVLFDYGNAAIIRRDRTGGPGAYAGGTMYFQGKLRTYNRISTGRAEAIQYQFAGPWWDFERLVFQQSWKTFAGYSTPGDPTTPPTFTTVSTSELFLGMTALGVYQTTGAQITEALNWAIACGVAVQAGTIDPATNIPHYNARDITVAEVIRQMLRWTPDCIAWFDYTLTPPKLHIRKLSNLTNATIAASARLISTLSLTPRFDLQLNAVCLRFRQVNLFNGLPQITFTNQNYPGGATGAELDASVNTIELIGAEQTNVYGTLVCAAIDAQSGVAATRLAWWQKKNPLFTNAKIDPASISVTSATIVDSDTGSTVSLATYPNELLKGEVAAWMRVSGTPVAVVDVTVKATVTYKLYADTAHTANLLLKDQPAEEVSVRIRATNAVSGTYSTIASYSSGEPIPANLARDIYNAYSSLQFDGEIKLLAQEVPSGFGMGMTVNVDTGSVVYSNLLVQSVSEDLGSGTMTLSVGPPNQLGVTDLIELLRVNRYRIIYHNPATQSAGTVQATNVQMASHTPKENTTTGLGNKAIEAVSADAGGGNTAFVKKDAAGQQILIEVRDASGALVSGQPTVTAKLSDLSGTNKDAKFRWLYFKDANDSCHPKKMMVLATAPEAA